MRVVLFCAVLLAVLCGPPPVLSQPGEETPEERNDVTPTNPVGEGNQAIFAGLDAENVMEDAAAVEAEDRAEDAATAAVATADGATAATTETAEAESRPNKRMRTSGLPAIRTSRLPAMLDVSLAGVQGLALRYVRVRIYI